MRLATALGALLAGAALCGPAPAQTAAGATQPAFPAQRLTIATGTRGTAYNLIGLELAAQARAACPACEVTVLETAGGIENMELLRQGRADVALVNASAAWEASIGINQFKDKPAALRALAALYPNSMHLVARRGAGISVMADLRGKRVATGAPGSGTEVIANQMLRAAGIDPDSGLQRRRDGLVEAVKAMRAGELDAFLFGAAVPVAPIAELLKEGRAELLPTVDGIKGMNRIYSHLYREGSIPADSYPGQSAEVKPLDVWDLAVVSESLPGPVAFELTRRLFEHQADFVKAHPNMRQLAIDRQSAQTTVSFHLGAQRFYASRGLQPFARQFGAAQAARPPAKSAPAH